MAKLVLTAENFAFGPIGKLLDVVDLLKEQGHELTFAGFGTSLQLAKNYPFDTIHEIDTDNPESDSKLEGIISKADMLISTMDIPSVKIAQQIGKLTTWIDCLFWFWDSIPDEVLNVDLYVTERLMNDKANEQKYASKIKNLFKVGPIIGRMSGGSRKNQVLISYGGGEAPYWYKEGRDTNYPSVMTNLLLKSIDWSKFDKVIVTTSERIAKELSDKFPDTPFEFKILAHDKFLDELSHSEVILITPGLVTAELAFESGTPTIFLPPSNNSQYLQLDQFIEQDLAPAHTHLSNFMPRLELKGVPLCDSTQMVLKQLKEFEQSPETQKRVGGRLNKLIGNRDNWSNEFVANGKRFIDSLGGNGAYATADKIKHILTANGYH
ncbi:MAG: UDP-glucose/GDP-mannose dehydrogenase [Candidatus Amesbacteria bacterium GW2011_GWB1_47_19]|nr:MAG: UDP-glucose/GDP-mannose dehydrogenase [Candidatus Amesbacteria bacterium GW2011_GWA1_44_24]KKU31037.1 MAG: UDP-glucose/GDP-mannose dehydrogenase [Candidatus Amesbacteria bacterium GW2011_GWC1_46_24]KKU66653.1 MAG: UDP-glucose/GDP-mannose dehydrogenase [Candidatus Amesbacteria bacterium GW2011_GWB1_47_19]OGD06146.1 MAG: hypothetical protein A2379_03580 [Candidatus Amesbacteria bacterium RIFOXYB1_FULL_47_13]HBC72258.1 hypothetical protein [Candidatus Amesbacteria bacterium]